MEMYSLLYIFVPTFNNELRTDKPPLHYFFMMASYHVFGITPFAARFFSSICGIILIAFLYHRLEKIVNQETAFFSCMVLLSSLQLGIQFHLAVPDPYLILCLTVSFFSFFSGFHENPKHYYLMYASAALGFLAKGLIAVVFPSLVIFLYLLYTRQFNWSLFSRLKILPGVLIFFIIAAPWYVAVGYATQGRWLQGFFIDHNLDRYTSTMEGHGGFPLAPFVILFASLLPFSVFIIQAFAHAWRHKQQPFLVYCMIVVGVIGIFFCFSKTILPSYPAPAIPFLATILGYFLSDFVNQPLHPRSIHISLAIHLIIALAIPAGVYIALHEESNLASLDKLAILFCILPLGSIVAWILLIKSRLAFVYVQASSWIVTLLIFLYIAYPKVDERNPVAESLSIINRQYPNHIIVAYKQFNPAYVFALKHPIPVVASLDSLSKTSQKFVVLSNKKSENDFTGSFSWTKIYHGKDLFEGGETIVHAN
jgi:4-amino-4-deoxy-L-arabinose transferase-like glycosyltransferase